jgi:UDP-glucose:(heptosyl)LPS alpha-1,3-glucosyltransferase
LKIALITKRVSQSLGGAERVSANLAGKLSEAGHDVHIFTGHVDTAVEGTETHLIKTIKWLSPLRLLSFQRKVRNILRKEKFDLVYSLCQVYPVDIYRVGDGIHRHWMKVQYPGALLRWMKYLTSLVHLVMRSLEGKIFQNTDSRLFITNSQLVKNQIIEYFHIPEEKIKVIYNGVDSNVFNPGVKEYRNEMRRKHQFGDKDLVILFVSNNWERKGLSTIIEAISKAGNEKIRLLVVGRGNSRHYISLATEKKIGAEQIIFIGRTGDVEKYYGVSDIFVLPSRYEPFANVCLEAMACGLPVITTRTNGAAEVITHGRDGFILDDWRDSSGLASIIKDLTAESLRREIGENAAKTAKSYTWQRHLEETRRVFDLIVGQNPKNNRILNS